MCASRLFVGGIVGHPEWRLTHPMTGDETWRFPWGAYVEIEATNGVKCDPTVPVPLVTYIYCGPWQIPFVPCLGLPECPPTPADFLQQRPIFLHSGC